jgi:hypothetical protein
MRSDVTYITSDNTLSICYLQNIVDNPSGALIKAVLLNGAQFLQGVDNGADGVTEIKPYDNNQGFGRMSLQGELLTRYFSGEE